MDLFEFYLFAVIGLMYVAIGFPLYIKKIPRNNWYGFRVPKTLESDEIWYPVNQRTGLGFILGGGGILMGICLIYLLNISFTNTAITSVMLIGIITTVCIVDSMIFLRKRSN